MSEWDRIAKKADEDGQAARRRYDVKHGGSGVGGCLRAIIGLSISFGGFVFMVWIALKVLGR